MKIDSFTVALTVDRVKASRDFLITYFGFTEKMGDGSFSSLTQEESGANIIYMQTGIPVLPEFMRNTHSRGNILAFVTHNIDAE